MRKDELIKENERLIGKLDRANLEYQAMLSNNTKLKENIQTVLDRERKVLINIISATLSRKFSVKRQDGHEEEGYSNPVLDDEVSTGIGGVFRRYS